MASIGEARATQIQQDAHEAGLTDQQLIELADSVDGGMGMVTRLLHLEQLNRKQADRLESQIAATARKREQAARQAAAGTSEPLATDRQVDYILTLLAKRRRTGNNAGFMTGPTSREDIQRMTRQKASAYIDSLTETY